MVAFLRRIMGQRPTASLRGQSGDGGVVSVRRSASALEETIQRIARGILEDARSQRHGVLWRQFWSDQLMDWAMRDPAFKVQFFRFVDVFPNLAGSEQVHQHLTEYLSQDGVTLPTGLKTGLRAGGWLKGTLAKTIASQIESMARNFIAGEDATSALPELRKLWDRGLAFSVDLLGEACVSDVEARAYQQRYLDLINTLPEHVNRWTVGAPDVHPGLHSVLDVDHLGPIPRTNVSIKISSLYARTSPVAFEDSIRGLMDALRPILDAARRSNVFLNFDMEQHALKDLTIELFQRCCEENDFPAGLALQAYLRSAEEDASRLITWAKRTGRQVTVRLIKGAYWDYEVAHAERMGWPMPVWTRKRDTDACFERVAAQFVEAMPRSKDEGGVKLALGSHNVRSLACGLALLQQHDLPTSALEIQMLHGMAEELKAAIVQRGLRLREYVPVGQMIPGMAYLVRRLLENTSNESWLRAGFGEDAPVDELLASPVAATAGIGETTEAQRHRGTPGAEGAIARDASVSIAREEEQPSRVAQMNREPLRAPVPPVVSEEGTSARGGPPTSSVSDTAGTAVLRARRHGLSMAVPEVGDGEPFFSEPPRDFAVVEARTHFADAVAAAQVPPIGHYTSLAQADAVVATAHRAFASWRDVSSRQRAAVLLRAAHEMRRRRDELAGIMIREAGKTWVEADVEVCEAIDFCEFYAREAVAIAEPRRLGRFTAELNQQWHEPRGVAVIISPWNFPLSICTGMTTAALVTGNSVLVKPAEQTPGIALALCEILWHSGAPRDVLHFVPGRGETVGAALVRDARVAIIAFTGSKDVGLDIYQAAAITPPRQPFVKRVICEMGGKNAIIVDSSADLDEAVLGVRQSAFGFAGQKCSACSRVIVLDDVHDLFLRRLVESTASLAIGEARDPATDVGPVIDQEAADKIRSYIPIGMSEGKLELAMSVPAGLEERVSKPYVGPHIFSGIRPEHRLAQEEIFGPVLSVMRAGSFDEAIAIANSTSYKLTGGVFSRTPSHLEQARRQFRVGNLYLNRGITGALVARQPFGGIGLSGIGSKAGGREYLLQFTDSRVCTETTLRRGFAPEIDAMGGGPLSQIQGPGM